MRYILAFGVALCVIATMAGAVFKIQSWAGGGIFFLLGTVILPLLLLVLLAVKLILDRKPKDVLDLDSIPEKREKQVLRRDDPEDLIV